MKVSAVDIAPVWNSETVAVPDGAVVNAAGVLTVTVAEAESVTDEAVPSIDEYALNVALPLAVGDTDGVTSGVSDDDTLSPMTRMGVKQFKYSKNLNKCFTFCRKRPQGAMQTVGRGTVAKSCFRVL